MIKFLDILGRFEISEFSQLEAAELLEAGERTFRHWRQRFEQDGEAGLLDRRLGKAPAKPVPAGRESKPQHFIEPAPLIIGTKHLSNFCQPCACSLSQAISPVAR